MRSIAAILPPLYPSGTVALTGAAPQTGVGLAANTRLFARGSLSAKIDYNIKASSLTYAATWQACDDASTWVAIRQPNAPADVVFATGSGSDVAASLLVAAPEAVYGYRYARLVITTGGSATGVVGHDNFAVAYHGVKSSNGS